LNLNKEIRKERFHGGVIKECVIEKHDAMFNEKKKMDALLEYLKDPVDYLFFYF
jgi:hypothetical protein